MLIFISLSDDPLSGFFMGSEACQFVNSLGANYRCSLMEVCVKEDYADSTTKTKILALSKELIPLCDEVWIFGDRLGGLSGEEKKIAIENGKKIKRINSIHMRAKVIPEEYI